MGELAIFGTDHDHNSFIDWHHDADDVESWPAQYEKQS